MGCGASKSAQVAESDITIKDYPLARSHGSSPVRSPQSTDTVVVSDRGGAEGEGVRLIPSDQSVIERAAQERLRQPPYTHPHAPMTPPLDTTKQERTHQHARLDGGLPEDPSSESFPPPVAFEVCMSPDGQTAPRAPPPRRLAKLDSAPKLTADSLVEKQKEAEERRHKEIERKASKRLSKKDRLLREVMAARGMEDTQQQPHTLPSGEEESTIYDASTEFEVDTTFNTDQNTGFWGGNNHDPGNIQHMEDKEKGKDITNNTRTDDDLFFDDGEQINLLDSNSSHSEQYM